MDPVLRDGDSDDEAASAVHEDCVRLTMPAFVSTIIWQEKKREAVIEAYVEVVVKRIALTRRTERVTACSPRSSYSGKSNRIFGLEFGRS